MAVQYLILPQTSTYVAPAPSIYTDILEIEERWGSSITQTTPMSCEEISARLSAGLFALSRPVIARSIDDFTLLLFGPLFHPDPSSLVDPTKNVALQINDQFTIAIHPTFSTVESEAAYLAVGVSPAEISNIFAQISQASIQSPNQINVLNLIPPSLLPLKTQAEMEADGWFDVEEL